MKCCNLKFSFELNLIVNELIELKAKGIHAQCKVNNAILDSDTVTMDSAYLMVFGKTEKEFFDDERKYSSKKSYIALINKFIREEEYAKMLEESRSKHINKITLENVLAGLKFIIKNQDMEHVDLVEGLLNLGCNYTLKEVRLMKKLLDKDLSKDEIRILHNTLMGATYIINIRDYEYSLDYVISVFKLNADSAGIYNFIKFAMDEENTKKLSKTQNL